MSQPNKPDWTMDLHCCMVHGNPNPPSIPGSQIQDTCNSNEIQLACSPANQPTSQATNPTHQANPWANPTNPTSQTTSQPKRPRNHMTPVESWQLSWNPWNSRVGSTVSQFCGVDSRFHGFKALWIVVHGFTVSLHSLKISQKIEKIQKIKKKINT